MDATAELFEGIEEHPRAGVIRSVKAVLEDLQRLNKRHGGILTKAQVAVLTGLDKSRIHQLEQSGVFRRVELQAPDGETLGIFVPVPDVLEWLKSNPRPGRPASGSKFVLAASRTK